MKTPKKNYIRHGGEYFHERAVPDAYHLALKAMAGMRPGARVLDLAAGAGLTSVRMAEMGYAVTAYDIFPQQFVPRHIKCEKTDLNKPIPEGACSADGVLALEVIEHLENPRGFLREVGRVLRPGGILVLSTPNIVSIKSKLRFVLAHEYELFFADRVRDGFCDEAGGHISPLLPWMLDFFLEDVGLRVTQRSYTRLYGLRSKHLGRCMVVQAEKNPATAP